MYRHSFTLHLKPTNRGYLTQNQLFWRARRFVASATHECTLRHMCRTYSTSRTMTLPHASLLVRRLTQTLLGIHQFQSLRMSFHHLPLVATPQPTEVTPYLDSNSIS